ncbi:HD domain-containing phosphohydrolase [Holophaga foetida]|uniref:HD domain-containing phosphohydrolase n=1 Tax=Holophaga foetida TaxID=35839 RepID=UPI0002474696|nr:HD domain-containing phosphohydrolase [Holophaga foetida]
MLIATQFKPMPFEWPLPGQEPRDFRVLVVDDQEIVRIMLIKILQRNGFEVLEAASGPETLTLLERERVDLILSDIKMPGMNGIELVKAIQPRIPETSIVMVSSLDNVEMSMECLRLGAYGYVLKPFKTNGILVAVANALRRRMLELHFRDREAILAQKVREQTTEIRQSREEIAFRLLAASEHRDNETGAHVRRIGLYAAAMGRILGMDENTLEHLGAAAQMHDIGKIGVPDRILQKDGHLTPEEWIIMKTHTTMGANILRDSAVPFIEMGARIAACHHEKFDGTGYPAGQAGVAIPIEARITALVDVYDALSSKRIYKRAWSEEATLQYIRENRDRHFDGRLVDVFLNHFEAFRAILNAHPDQFAGEEYLR